MKTRPTIAITALTPMLIAAPALAQEELWRQDPINSVGGLSSQDARNPGGLGWFSEVVDNFDAEQGWTINNVEFWGGYVQVQPGNTEGFTIRIYEDNGGAVGTRVFEQDVFTFTETPFYTNPSGIPGYHTEVDLSPPFSVPRNGAYWVSVVAILARGGGANEPQWGWVQSIIANQPFAQQWFFSPGNFNPQNNDVSFVLNGSTSTSCYPDCDLNTTLDIFDFLCFQDAFVMGDPYADCDGNTVFDIFDFLCFQDAFVVGCP